MSARPPDLANTRSCARRGDRRQFLKSAAVGTVLMGFGGALLRIAADDLTRAARAGNRPDGRPRLPPGQRALEQLRAMGGEEGDGDVKAFRLRVHGACKSPFEVDYAGLLKLPIVDRAADVHCVTGWSLLGAMFKGVQVSTLADLAEDLRRREARRSSRPRTATPRTCRSRKRPPTTPSSPIA